MIRSAMVFAVVQAAEVIEEPRLTAKVAVA